MEDECDQLRREICALEATHDNLVVRYRPLFREDSREPKRAKLEEELEQVQQNLRTKREHLKLKEAEYTQSIQRLRKLPPEVWEKILDELDENDLFPLALSCRYFEQMQTVQEEVLRIKRMKIERMMKVAEDAGESSLSHSSLFWVLTSFYISLLHSARRPTGDLAAAQEQRLSFTFDLH